MDKKIKKIGSLISHSIITYPLFYLFGIKIVEKIWGKQLSDRQKKMLNFKEMTEIERGKK